MSDFRQDISNIIQKSNTIKSNSTKAYYYPNIPEKVIKGIRKRISGDISVNSVVAVFDFSMLENGNTGLVFTVNGIYYKDLFVKKIYFNYKDIKDIYYGGIYINVKIGDKTYDISNVCIDEINFIPLVRKLRAYATEQGLESQKVSGKIKKEKMPKELYNKCNMIIHGASVACGAVGAGLAQLPCADTVPITTAQVGMVIALGQVFELNITDGVARGILTGMSGSFIGRGIVQVAFGWIPVAGNAINTATAAGLTEAIGWTVADQFYNQSLDNIVQYSYEGELKGFKDASDLYERKLREQAKSFLEQKKVLKEKLDELNSIINEYEIYIAENMNTKAVTVSIMKDEVATLKKIRNAS